MFRAFVFLIKVALVAAGAIWLAERPGSIDVGFGAYTLSTESGIFLLMVAVAVAGLLFVIKIFDKITAVPRRIVARREEHARKRGYRALTRGFVAIAAGDAKSATRLAHQACSLLPGDNGLPVLLEAQAARLRGEEGAARRSFEKLLHDRDASFFGMRGLLKSALDAGDYDSALEYAYKTLSMHPRQPWILRTVYMLELKNQKWEAAGKTLDKIAKARALPEQHTRQDRIALLLIAAGRAREDGHARDALHLLEKACKLDPLFIPAVRRLAESYLDRHKNRKASAIIEKAWKENPHPDLLPLWERLAPENKSSDPLRRLRHYEKLVALKPDSAEGQMAAARAALQDGFWGEARAYLTVAEQIEPSAKLYKLRARIEEETTHDDKAVRLWLEKAADAPPSKVWTCAETGAVYEHWSPVALPHGAFNTIVWGYPFAERRDPSVPVIDRMMIEAA